MNFLPFVCYNLYYIVGSFFILNSDALSDWIMCAVECEIYSPRRGQHFKYKYEKLPKDLLETYFCTLNCLAFKRLKYIDLFQHLN